MICWNTPSSVWQPMVNLNYIIGNKCKNECKRTKHTVYSSMVYPCYFTGLNLISTLNNAWKALGNPFQNVGGRIIVLMTSFGNGDPIMGFLTIVLKISHQQVNINKGFLIFQFFHISARGGFRVCWFRISTYEYQPVENIGAEHEMMRQNLLVTSFRCRWRIMFKI